MAGRFITAGHGVVTVSHDGLPGQPAAREVIDAVEHVYAQGLVMAPHNLPLAGTSIKAILTWREVDNVVTEC